MKIKLLAITLILLGCATIQTTRRIHKGVCFQTTQNKSFMLLGKVTTCSIKKCESEVIDKSGNSGSFEFSRDRLEHDRTIQVISCKKFEKLSLDYQLAQ